MRPGGDLVRRLDGLPRRVAPLQPRIHVQGVERRQQAAVGNAQHEDAARAEDAVHLGEYRGRLGDMLEHVEHDNGIDGAVAERESRRIALEYLNPGKASSRLLDVGGVTLDSDDLAASAPGSNQCGGSIAERTADVEHKARIRRQPATCSSPTPDIRQETRSVTQPATG